MTKKKDKTYPRAVHIDRDNWQSLFGQLTEVIDWGLDIANKLSRDDDDDQEAIENVRKFVHAWLQGRRAEVPITDLLTTIAILFAAIELDLGIDSVSVVAPLRTMLDTPTVLPGLLRCPGAVQRPFAFRRFPGRRNASAAFTQAAA